MLILRRLLRAALALVAAIAVVVAVYAADVWLGMRATARIQGTIAGLPLDRPVQILRDARGIPHIRAADERDLFFAEGYVQGQDRLFQLDLLRRYVYGRLAEVLGSPVVAVDEASRSVPVAQIVQRQWTRLSPHERMLLEAFAGGINAAAQRESTPVEFRALAYRFERWQPQDALAVGFATVLELTDDWQSVAERNGREPLSAPCFDAPVTAGLRGIAHPDRCYRRDAIAQLRRALADARPPIGSNEWASGSSNTATRRALLANDPHLRLQIPGVWYLVDLEAPGYHAAGATLAGTPGVILGHNDHIAWGATNGTTTALSVFADDGRVPSVIETIHVRFSRDVHVREERSGQLFGATVYRDGQPERVLVRWPAYTDPRSPLATFDALDRAPSIDAALRALRAYPGPTQNFVIASASGRAAYQLAGVIPADPLWGRGVHPARDLAQRYPAVPFDALPRVAPSRGAIVWTSNNKMYAPGYPFRLSAQFAPPCRAFRVATMLARRRPYRVDTFARMQMDVLSPCEQTLAQWSGTLRGWNGEVTPSSSLATAAIALRMQLQRGAPMIDLLQRMRPIAASPQPSPLPWSQAGAVRVMHPLAALGLSFLNGSLLPGDGDSYTVHVQAPGFSQSFRAVWDAGNWDAGGITIPQGESGRPGSGHYTDEAAPWVAGRLLALPFSRKAVDRAAIDRLTLLP